MKVTALVVLAAVVVGQADDARLTKAKAMLDALNKGDYDAAARYFDKTMTEKMPPEKCKEIWTAVTKQIGAFKKVERTETSTVKTATIIDLVCEFEKTPIKLRLAFDNDDKIQGFFLLPATQPKYEIPPYAKADAFREENRAEVGDGVGGVDGRSPREASSGRAVPL